MTIQDYHVQLYTHTFMRGFNPTKKLGNQKSNLQVKDIKEFIDLITMKLNTIL